MPNARNRGRQPQRPNARAYAGKPGAAKLAAARAEATRAARRRNLLFGGGAVVLVLVVVVVIVIVGVSGKKSKPTGNPVAAASLAVTAALGKAAAVTSAPSSLTAVTGPPSRLTGAALTSSAGKPQVLYIGADWCPFCAATRWPLTVALSRFGTFSNLQTTKSSATDVNPNTPTLSYHGASYTSSYIDFVGLETQDGASHALDPLTADQTQLFQKLTGSHFPFVDFGGKWMQKGASADPSILAGLTPDAVAAQLADPTSKIGSSVQQGADVFSAVICSIDGGKPANVCTSPAVTTASSALAAIK